MVLPYMRTKVKFEEKVLREFGGINITETYESGELIESKNMSSKDYPALSVRPKYKTISQTDRTINGIGTCDGVLYTSYSEDESCIYLNYDGEEYEFTEYSASADFTLPRKIASLSDTVLIIPDNVVFWVNSREFTSICVSQIHDKTSALAKFDKETGGSDLLSKSYVEYVATLSHNRIECRKVDYNHSGAYFFYYSFFDSSLKEGDVVTIKGTVYSDRGYGTDGYGEYCSKIKKGIECKIKSVETVTHTTPTGSVTETVTLFFEDHSIDTGGFSDVCFKNISIERGIPNLQDICSFNNRIWAISGKQIYASKLADASEWNDFTSDAYGTIPYASFQTSSQTEGDFTGIISYGNNIYAFKENAIHKIMGNQPDEYTIHTTMARGVGKNMGATLCLCGDSLVYCAGDGVYAYRGDYPGRISEKLGFVPNGICAGANGNDYYILCENSDARQICVYDTKRKIWHNQECDDKFSFMTSNGGDVFLAGGGRVILLTDSGRGVDAEKNIHWSFKIRFDERSVGKRGMGKLMMRYSLGDEASFVVRAVYDDNSKSAVCGARYDEVDSGGYTLSMPLKRSLWFTLEFEGVGEFKLKSVNLKFYRGSEI